MTLALLHGAQSDVGRKRSHNEDHYGIDLDLGLFVVCDGMGGGNAGEVASALAVDTIHRHFLEAGDNPDMALVGEADDRVTHTTNRLASAIRLANRAIVTSAQTHREWAGMGTTVVAAAFDEDRLCYAHVGDSRLYLVRNRTMQQLTKDHSWVAEQVAQGLLTEEEAERSPRRNLVTQALGAHAAVEVSLGELPLVAGDRLLLCSDGLTKDVPDSLISQILLDEADVPILTQKLITVANDTGGDDNITVIVLVVREQSKPGLWRQLRQRLAL